MVRRLRVRSGPHYIMCTSTSAYQPACPFRLTLQAYKLLPGVSVQDHINGLRQLADKLRACTIPKAANVNTAVT